MPPPLVSILVPAYGEAGTIGEVVRRVLALDGLEIELLVIDDGSTDATVPAAREAAAGDPRLRVLTHDRNRGKGAAVRTGIEASRGDIVVIQDADMEYDPRDLPKVLQPLLDGAADVVYGTRLRGGEPQRAHLFWHFVGNRFLSLLTNILFNTTISDMEVGYKAFRGDLIRSFRLVSDDFAFEPEVTAKVLRTPGVRLYEIPISYYGRSYDEGKKITWRDGFKAVWTLLRFRFARV
ncbi:glycosyltransferase family 2 protein [Baekduia soli]|uniref:Glycosyltransferase family 2 protein n=1 Tax=Baekduia soli TaxID=496014 RepID=A0A5B8UAD8_9ACTN|nr:glycosyltransferase family 2 protein [Baekduia soli]QEC49571.1 glycosyltransferase family 2 protein [Baekduia soli]